MGRHHLRKCSRSLKDHRSCTLGNVFLLTFNLKPHAQMLQIRASPQRSFGLWLGKDVITGMHIVTLMDGQILRTRTITRLTREDQFKLEEFKKFKVAVHESGVLHKEDSYDQMLFKDLVRRFLLQQRNPVTFESSESDSRVIHSPDSLQESSAQERLQSLQSRERVVQIKEYRILQDYLNHLEDESPASNHLQSSKSTCSRH